jgi:hypothetical protein
MSSEHRMDKTAVKIVDKSGISRCLSICAAEDALRHKPGMFYAYMVAAAVGAVALLALDVLVLRSSALLLRSKVVHLIGTVGLCSAILWTVDRMAREAVAGSDAVALWYLRLWRRSMPISSIDRLEIWDGNRGTTILTMHFNDGSKWTVRSFKRTINSFAKTLASPHG